MHSSQNMAQACEEVQWMESQRQKLGEHQIICQEIMLPEVMDLQSRPFQMLRICKQLS